METGDSWNPQARFTLSVREITSVSATFILSADPSLSDFSWDEDDSEDSRVIPDALSKGLSVLVNGAPWQRVLMRIDDAADEAIIIIYGLMPGRQYDIELGVAPGDEGIRGQVTTERNARECDAAYHCEWLLTVRWCADPELEEPDGESSQGEDDSESTLAGSTTSSPSATPAPLPLPLTAEQRAAQLQQTLSALADEQMELANTLKTSRRDAQKADAALRAEIEVLKRASEKQAAAEARARQKILALQEAAKQAAAASSDAANETRELERTLPALQAQVREREAEHARVKVDAGAARMERESEAVAGRKREEAARAELTGLGNKLDKLCAKRDKLESGTITDLEEQLRALQEEIERVQRDPYAYLAEVDALQAEEGAEDEEVEPEAYHHSRTQSAPVSLRGRPPLSVSHQPTRTVIGRPGPIQRPHYGPHHMHHTVHHHHPSIVPAPRPPQAAPTIASTSTPRKPVPASSFPPLSATVSTPKSQTTTNTATPSPSSQSSTALSSRAQPFQPRRGSKASELNPTSTPFEPKSILVNPNRAKMTQK